MTIDLNYYKAKLNEEKKLLEKELQEVGRKNPDNPTDWEPVAIDRDVSQADENTVADNLEELEDNTAIVSTLEKSYANLNKALERIGSGTYGFCEICGKEIEKERLDANPSAHTCKEHRDKI
jgi:RNA polymerase-binding transcription factor DksA